MSELLGSRLKEAAESSVKLETPVAFLIFNRPDLTREVFAAIAQARPPQLYLIADGPRSAAEAEKCRLTREVVERIDWECEVHRNYSETNLGCGRRVSSGISWVLEREERAIIIEDDCLPDQSFFGYCQEMLERYADDERIMHITGGNYLFNQVAIPESYYFSHYSFVWGWATWRRAWRHFERLNGSWPQLAQQGEGGQRAPRKWLEERLDDPEEAQYWRKILQMMVESEKTSWWDFQWYFTCWIQNGLTVAPCRNLVSNLGFRADATHTNTAAENLKIANLARESLAVRIHPAEVVRNREADYYNFRNFYQGARGGPPASVSRMEYLLNALKRRLAWRR